MSQTAVAKLSWFIDGIAPWLEAHPSTPGPWRRNVRAFLRNRAEETPSIRAWKWLRRAIAHPREDKIVAPFAWVRAVLQNPLDYLAERKERFKRFRSWEREEEKRSKRSDHLSLISSESLRDSEALNKREFESQRDKYWPGDGLKVKGQYY